MVTMSRNQQDAAARKRHREQRIARVQRERDIAELRPLLMPLPQGYNGEPIIKISPSALPDCQITFTLSDDDGIASDYKEDISTPFNSFYFLQMEDNSVVFPYFIHVSQTEHHGGGSYHVTMLFFELLLPIGLMVWYVIDDDGNRVFQSARAGFGFYTEFEGDGVDNRTAGFDIIRQILSTLFTLCKLLSLSNIELVDEPPNPRISEIHEREFGRPLTTYKVLKVNTSHKEYYGRDKDTGIRDFDPRRMHVVRGHHAEYGTNGRKLLFGKYQRKIWIPAHVRGNEELGIVVKDYEVVGKPTA